MRDVTGIAKQGVNEDKGWNYAKASDVLESLQQLMVREGLNILQTEVDMFTVKDDQILAVTYQFIPTHISGETWAGPVVLKQTGMALLEDDKAANKCATAALKYFLINLFKIPTRDTADADAKTGAVRKLSTGADIIAVPTIAAPDTPRFLPFDLKKDNPVAWASVFVSKLLGSVSVQELRAWVKENQSVIETLKIEAPGAHERIEANVATCCAQINETLAA